MPFAPGNKLWKKSLEAKKEIKENFLNMVASGGLEQYGEKLDSLAHGKELSNPEIEFLNRMDKLLPYVAPKLSKQEVSGPEGEPITFILKHGNSSALQPADGKQTISGKDPGIAS